MLRSVAAITLSSAMLVTAAEPGVRRLDGSTISRAEIDGTVARLMKAAEVTGVGIAIFNGGRVAFQKAYGFRDKEKQLPLTEDSVMGGASLSKVAFAYLVMQLVDDGLVDLDKPVEQYLPKPLPEYAVYRDLAGDPRYKKITPRMLLSHTSGFPNFRWLEDDGKLNIHFEPGSRFAYSGEGIQLLQFVVETITNRPLQDLMQERVFGPLGMSRSSMVSETRFESELPARKPLPPHTKVSLDPKLLDRLTGRYALPPGVALIVTRKGDHLRVGRPATRYETGDPHRGPKHRCESRELSQTRCITAISPARPRELSELTATGSLEQLWHSTVSSDRQTKLP